MNGCTFAAMQTAYALDTILSHLKIDTLNEMQSAAIAATDQNTNVVLLSATGSGKTLAFLLPILKLLDKENKATQAKAGRR
jgi:superfamily II DNA/RNA helicase